MDFKKISQIDPDNEKSYKNSIFLTFDMDWSPDYIIQDLLELLSEYNIHCTFFVTNHCDSITFLRESKNYDLGIHPNFNYLLNGDTRLGKNYLEVLTFYTRLVPEAISVRSHSLTQNTYIIQALIELGFRYELNTYIPYNSGINLKPFHYFTKNLIKIPHFWEDDIYLYDRQSWDFAELSNYGELKVFNFHPVHIYLNTFDMEDYNKAKKFIHLKHKFDRYINKKKFGIKDFLKKILTC